MGRKAKMAAGATAVVVSGPSGLRRTLGGCLVVGLLAILVLGGGAGVLTWLGSRALSSDTGALPCPPETVQVHYLGDPPPAVREQVEAVIAASARKVGATEDREVRDLRVVWTPGTDPVARPALLRLGEVPTRGWVERALAGRLTDCEAAEAAEPVPAAEKPAEGPPISLPDVQWPWSQGWTATTGLAVGLAVWWVAGPNLLRAGWRGALAALWPLRLAGRHGQRWRYRHRLRKGWLPTEWPDVPSPGQRWHEDATAMRDHRTPRQQARATEPARRAAVRDAVRAERLGGTGLGPAQLWQAVYREGAPKNVDV